MSEVHAMQAQCLCGAVRLRAAEAPKEIGACHCQMCRRWGGGPLLAVHCGTAVEIEGGEHVRRYKSSEWAERGFCQQCGTHLFYRLSDAGEYVLPAGLFDDGDQFKLTEQIFIDEKPAYYDFANVTDTMTGAEVFAKYGAPEG